MEWHNDDQPVGRVLSRREVLTLLGGSGMALAIGTGLPRRVAAQDAAPTATALPTCVVKPELTEGPYFVDDQLNRFDIRVDPSDEALKAGLPLHLIFRVTDVTDSACAPLPDALVDIWHCDADGVYSGVADPGFDTSGQLWLRGNQITDASGIAEFLTIVPGWYPGRAVHIHFKIRTTGTDSQSYDFTSQLFFDPAQIAAIYAEAPYVARGLPNTPNTADNIYRQSGDMLTLDLVEIEPEAVAELQEKSGDLTVASGYTATFDIGLDLSDAQVGASDSAGFGGGRGPGGSGG
jgi:protocatechuate 3,4-dioxygenase beta subunit